MAPFYLFSIRGIPVYLSIFYLLLIAWIGYRQGDITSMLIWVVVVTASLLVHEFGHAFMAARYRLAPKVLLHGWGGLTIHDHARRDSHDALIIASGPGAGLALAAVVWAVWAVIPDATFMANPRLYEAMSYLWFVNFYWSLINLIPFWPLDGGQLFRLGLLRVLEPMMADRVTHVVGIGLAIVGMAAGWLLLHSIFMMLLAGLLGWENLKRLRPGESTGPVRSRASNKAARELVNRARQELTAGNLREAARLGFQARDHADVDEKVLSEAWEIITLGNFGMGRLDEGLRFAQYAPRTVRVIEACARAHLALGHPDELEELARLPEWDQVSQEVRDAVAAALGPGSATSR